MSKRYKPITIKTLKEEKNLLKDMNLVIKDINTNFRLIASSINQNAETLIRATGSSTFAGGGGGSFPGGGGPGGGTTIINNNTFLTGLDYDQAVPTIDSDGNQTQTIYKRGGATIATETLTWEGDKLISRAIVGELTRTWTFTYDRQDNFSNVVKS